MSFRARLAIGPTRGLGCANEIVSEVLRLPALLPELIDVLENSGTPPDPVVTVRAANALGKIQQKLPDDVAKYSRRLLRVTSAVTDLRTRWNLIEVVGRLPLQRRDRALAVDLLFEALASPSGFLRAFALTGLVQHARGDASLQRRLEPVLKNALEDPSAAVRARARKLHRIR